MNKRMAKKAAVGLVVALVALSVPAVCFADDAFTKLGRGVANTFTGWVELPKNIHSTSVEDNVFTGVTLGVAKGAGMTIVRTGAGIYEVATFPFPVPQDYRPILEPEYVF